MALGDAGRRQPGVADAAHHLLCPRVRAMEGIRPQRAIATAEGNLLSGAVQDDSPGHFLCLGRAGCHLGHRAMDSALGRPDDPRPATQSEGVHPISFRPWRSRRLFDCPDHRRQAGH